MKRPILTLAVLCAFALAAGSPAVAERKSNERDTLPVKSKSKQAEPKQKATPASPSTGASVNTPTSTAPAQKSSSTDVTESSATTPPVATFTTAAPLAGEQIKWQVLSGGGVSSSSASYKMSATVGQTAAGPVSSASYKLNQGYWQNFSSGGCCIGTTGNVNKSVAEGPDISDLSLLIAYLTVSPKPALPCVTEANINGAGTIDISDLSLLIAYLTVSPKPVLPNCP
ncbi:MAG: hypothetical protein NDJ18_01005 [candidate division Zixibacteria bacterium]|nr:hypothetical protein [candidate division Zixibacteria bacterium]